MGKIHYFLWWCAGARIDILKQDECKNDHAKYFGIGGTILFTALMASFAGGYAFFTAFKNVPMAVFFGIFWGCLIFNLDRYIVSTLKDDGKATISKSELINASPRILMAILIGFVIATPLELKIFEPEIQTMVARIKIEKVEEMRNRDSSFNKDMAYNKDRLVKLTSDILDYTNNKKKYLENAVSFIEERKNELIKDSQQKGSELTEAQNKLNAAHNNYLMALKDSTGKYSDSQIANYKTIRDNASSIRNRVSLEKAEIDSKITKIESDKESAIKEEAAKIDKQINSLTSEKEGLLQTVAELDKINRGKIDSREGVVENYDGFAAHMHAMAQLGKEQSIIFWARILLTLLFIFIEVAPVLFKLMTELGPYDAIMSRVKHEIIVEEKQKTLSADYKFNAELNLSTEKHKAKIDAELIGTNKLMQAIALAQSEIAIKAVEKWKKQEMKKLDKSISHVISNENEKEENQETNFDDQEMRTNAPHTPPIPPTPPPVPNT